MLKSNNVVLFVVVAVMAVASNVFADGTKVSGFVDAQYKYKNDPNKKGFTVNDGAVYLGHEMNKDTSVKVDLPFSWSGAGALGTNTNSDFSVGATKAQAYITQKYEGGCSWKLGQFDTMFGIEQNDSPDRFFADFGRLSAQVIPYTHTGLAYNHNAGSWNWSAMVANQHDHGVQGGMNPEYGAQFAHTSNEMMKLTLGWLGSHDSATKGTNYLAEAMVGTKLGDISADFQFDFKKNVGMNKAWGLMSMFVYPVSGDFSAAARLDYMKDISAMNNQQQGSLGGQWKHGQNVKYKVDYTYGRAKAVTGGTFSKEHGANVAAVYSF